MMTPLSLPALILVGGQGTRLRSAVPNLPKPMAPIQGRPFLEYQLRYLRREGIMRITLLTGYKAEEIERYFEDGNKFGLQLNYSVESEPLGTGGAVVHALKQIHESRFLLLNGDSFFAISIEDFVRKCSSPFNIALSPQTDTSRYGLVELDVKNKVTRFIEKEKGSPAGLINGGVYLVERNSFLQNVPAKTNFSFEKDLLEKVSQRGLVGGVTFNSPFIDIGLPESLALAQTLVPSWIRES